MLGFEGAHLLDVQQLDDLAVLHHRDAVAHVADDAEIVAHHQVGQAAFCPQIGDVFEAAITRQADGDYRLELSTLVIGGPGDPCLFDFIGNVECATIEELTPRDLEDDEVAEMLALFGNLGVYLEPHEICDCIAIDPCRIGNFSWDTTDFSDFICSNRRLAENLDRDITNFLESLRGGPGR